MAAGLAISDIARVYASGSEPAKGGQTGGLPYPSGKELTTIANANLAVAALPGHELAR